MFLKRAKSLADQTSKTLIQARALSNAMLLGQHPQKRRGIGQDFWDFRPYDPTMAGDKIDWRQSARREKLFVREKEHEAAHKFLIIIDPSRRMDFSSNGKYFSKRGFANLFALALCFYLQRVGEVFSLAGHSLRYGNHDNHIQEIAEILIGDKTFKKDFDPQNNNSRNLIPIIFSDFWGEENELEQLLNITAMAKSGLAVQIADGAEIDFPFKGQNEFCDLAQKETILLERGEDFHSEYQTRIENHLSAIRKKLQARQFGFLQLRNDDSAEKQFLRLVESMLQINRKERQS